LVYVNQNNSENISNLSTAQPPTNTETIYYAQPANPRGRIPILELEASTNDQIFVAPAGNAIAYFVDSLSRDVRGLYTLDVEFGLTGRILATDSLNVRGIINTPSWKPDGSILAIAVEGGYSTEIFGFDVPVEHGLVFELHHGAEQVIAKALQ